MEAYLDNSATTQPCKEAIDKMNYALRTSWGNPSSLHAKGIAASELIEEARKNVAKKLSCEADEIYFTSGGTESNNIAVFGAANAQKRRGSRIITTSIEHSSIEESVKALENQGYDVVRLRVNERGVIDERQLYAATNPSVVLISMMYVNNEVGSIQPVEFAKRAVTHSGANALIHCDAVQAFGKVQLKPYNMGVDLMSISSHKIHGPKGAGALFVKKRHTSCSAHIRRSPGGQDPSRYGARSRNCRLRSGGCGDPRLQRESQIRHRAEGLYGFKAQNNRGGKNQFPCRRSSVYHQYFRRGNPVGGYAQLPVRNGNIYFQRIGLLKGTQEQSAQGDESQRGRYRHGTENQHVRVHNQGRNRLSDRRYRIRPSDNEEIKVNQTWFTEK